MRTFEDLIEDLGGLGKFQLILIVLVNSSQLFTGWSMLMMSYAGLVPDFYCRTEDNYTSASSTSLSSAAAVVDLEDQLGNDTLNVCSVNGTSCHAFTFTGPDHTVINEWELVCDQKWAKQIITSVQMGGVAVGAVLAGQISDVLGRKIAIYSFNLFHIIMNVIAAFSVSWVMFAAMRVLIGVGIGAILVIVFSYPMEFMPIKWRTLLSILPTWALGVSVFSVAAMVLENWSYLHLGCAILSVPSLLGWFFVPESVRWLTLKGRLEDARKVLEQISRVNNKPMPADVDKILQTVIETELKQNEANGKYTYFDLFKSAPMIKIGFVSWLCWFTLSMSFYGISFGVANLSGNIYLNIFLLAVLELPVRFSTFFWNNIFGRKKTTMFFLLFSALPSLGCLLATIYAPEDVRGTAVNVLSLVAKMFIGSAWSCSMMWTSELYPTVVRQLGYAWASLGARVGGILAPFLINLDEMPETSYVIMTAALFVCTFICVILEETNGKELSDSFQSVAVDKQNVNNRNSKTN